MAPFSIEAAEYKNFQRLWADNRYKGCRYGQAFFNHFDLHKMSNPDDKFALDRLYEMDGERAKAEIQRLFLMN